MMRVNLARSLNSEFNKQWTSKVIYRIVQQESGLVMV